MGLVGADQGGVEPRRIYGAGHDPGSHGIRHRSQGMAICRQQGVCVYPVIAQAKAGIDIG